MASIVIVHGAWTGGWAWRAVADNLAARGHRVLTPTLTGLGERAHLRTAAINLSTHIEDIVQAIRSENLRDIVLVGHSYGGMVVTGVADRLADRIAALVYLDAFLPADGQSLLDLVGPDGARTHLDGAANADGIGVPPMAHRAGDPAATASYQDRLTPHPLATMVERLRLSGAQERVRTKLYVWAANYGPNSPFEAIYRRLRADPSWHTAEIACGHRLNAERPEETAELIAGVA